MDDETENISPHSQKGRNCVHNTGFTLTGVLISVHETGLGVFSVSTKWDWGQILCPHLWVHYKKSLKPVRFINGQNGDYDEILLEINKPLMLIGLQMTNDR